MAALSFQAVDALAFSAARGRLDATLPVGPEKYDVPDLGPLIEFVSVGQAVGKMQAGSLTRLLDLPGDLARILPFLLAGRSSGPTAQLVMAGCHGADVGAAGEDGWISFLLSAQRAAAAVGIPARQGTQVVAAMKELASNVAEHSGAPETGMVAFRAAPPGRFEFAVADRGKGVLESLRTSSDYAGLASHAGKRAGAASSVGAVEACATHRESLLPAPRSGGIMFR